MYDTLLANAIKATEAKYKRYSEEAATKHKDRLSKVFWFRHANPLAHVKATPAEAWDSGYMEGLWWALRKLQEVQAAISKLEELKEKAK